MLLNKWNYFFDNILRSERFQEFPINPKALSLGELYGEFDLNTNEWTDGVLSSVMRQTCAGKIITTMLYYVEGLEEGRRKDMGGKMKKAGVKRWGRANNELKYDVEEKGIRRKKDQYGRGYQGWEKGRREWKFEEK